MSAPTAPVPSLTAMNTHYVPCTDATGRDRQMPVHIAGGRVVLTVPPGESARLTPGAARHLARELVNFAAEIDGQR